MKYILITAAVLFLFSFKKFDGEHFPSNESILLIDTIPDFYQRVIDITSESDRVRATINTADGGMVMVGDVGNAGNSRDGFILKTDSIGTIEWAKVVGFQQPVNGSLVDNSEAFFQVIELTDGSFIVGCRNIMYPSFAFHPLLFKFSKYGELIWSKEIIPPPTYENQALFFNITLFEEGFFVMGSMNEPWFQRSFILKMENNGELIWGKQYFNGNHVTFPYSFLSTNNFNGELHLYYDILKRLPTENILGFVRLDSIGDFISIKSYSHLLLEDLDLESGFNNKQVIQLFDGYLLGAWLGRENFFDFERKAVLLKIDTLGDIQWAKTYQGNPLIIEGISDIIQTEGEKVLVNFADEYSPYSDNNEPDPNESIVLAEINTNGDLLWNKVIDAGGREEYTRMELMDDQSLLLSAKSNSFATQTQGEWAIHQIKTDPNLYFGDCTPTDSLDIIVEDLEIIQDTFFLESMPFENIQDVEIPVVDADINVIMLCPEGDANLTIRDVFRLNPCESDSLKIKVRVCNTGYTATGQGVPMAIYDANPTEAAANLLLQQNLTTNLPPTVCRDVNFTLTMPATDQLFLAINDNAATATPYNPELVFGNAPFTDSDFFDNVKSFQITNYEAVFSQLDTSLCAGYTLLVGNVSIAAGASDTVFLQTFVGCDSIVMVQTTETFPVSNSQNIDLCFGDSVLIFGDFISEAGFYENTFTAASGCDSVQQFTVAVLEEITTDIFIQNEIGSGAMNGIISIENVNGGTAPFSYLWNTGATTAMIDNLSQGNYTVTITDGNDCQAVFAVEVDLEVATNNEVTDFDIKVVPNPSVANKDIQLWIQTSKSQVFSYEILDAKGKRLLVQENIPVIAGENYLPIDFGFSAGVYFVSVLEHGILLKFVVQ